MLHRAREFTLVILAASCLLVGSPGSLRAQVPPGNDTSDNVGNTGGGKSALAANGGGNNTAYGFDALFQNTTGSNNSAVGVSSLASTTGGDNNTASGVNALFSNTTGAANTASGVDALFNNTVGNENIAIGLNALFDNTTGSNNVASGAGALQFNTTGEHNTACGDVALQHNTIGVGNTAVGTFALGANKRGSDNIALGSGAGGFLTKGDADIYIGNPGETKESRTIRIGSLQKRTFIAGIATTPISGSTVTIDADGRLGVFLSSARYKRDIRDMGDGSDKLKDLRPVTFRYKEDASGERQYGLVAEEVARVYPELVVRSAGGEVQSVRYEELIPMLLNELQRQRAESAALAARLERLEELRTTTVAGR
jgi:hypothetical protein